VRVRERARVSAVERLNIGRQRNNSVIIIGFYDTQSFTTRPIAIESHCFLLGIIREEI